MFKHNGVVAEWQTQQTQNLPTINRVGSSPTSPTKAIKIYLRISDSNLLRKLTHTEVYFLSFRRVFLIYSDTPVLILQITNQSLGYEC